ncbi:GntR family transcriptional regulator [Kineosporia sp. A_224]|uniref:GntR family transcriptional regulator n=1 Tax=Kineosporia sp. A_224 TaxID=1962180 RepID=UPI000B4B78DB|nr:GntR family transcriptional regulator [Kineosporia sp. A_224]
MALDPNDSRPPYQQVAAQLRAAILTGKLAPGDQLPSGNEMAQTYAVARQTIQQALRILREEGLIVSRQGTGTFVKARTEKPVGLRPHLEAIFRAEEVTIDFAGFSGETLAGAIQEPLDKIRAGRLTPASIAIRVLIPDAGRPWGVPCLQDSLDDSPAFRERAAGIAIRSIDGIASSVAELQSLGLVPKATLEVRTHPGAAQFKVYILNRSEAFFGFYPVSANEVAYKGESLKIWDLLGKDSLLFHHARGDDESLGGVFVEQAQLWFDSHWDTVARPLSW